jgi:hypothetical protein
MHGDDFILISYMGMRGEFMGKVILFVAISLYTGGLINQNMIYEMLLCE